MPYGAALPTLRDSQCIWRLFTERHSKITEFVWSYFAYSAENVDITSIFLHFMQALNWKSRYLIRIYWIAVAASHFTVALMSRKYKQITAWYLSKFSTLPERGQRNKLSSPDNDVQCPNKSKLLRLNGNWDIVISSYLTLTLSSKFPFCSIYSWSHDSTSFHSLQTTSTFL